MFVSLLPIMLSLVKFASKHFDIALNVTPIFCHVTESWAFNYCNGYNMIHFLTL